MTSLDIDRRLAPPEPVVLAPQIDDIPDEALHGPPCTISELPRDLRTWCLLGLWLPAGWSIAPPFRPEFGAPWTVVAWNTRSTEASDLPWFEVGHGDEPIDALDDLLTNFEY